MSKKHGTVSHLASLEGGSPGKILRQVIQPTSQPTWQHCWNDTQTPWIHHTTLSWAWAMTDCCRLVTYHRHILFLSLPQMEEGVTDLKVEDHNDFQSNWCLVRNGSCVVWKAFAVLHYSKVIIEIANGKTILKYFVQVTRCSANTT